MDHVLVDTYDRTIVGRGLYQECIKAMEALGEHFRYKPVYCAEAKGFAAFTSEVLADIWLNTQGGAAAGFTNRPLVQYGTLCKWVRDATDRYPPLSTILSEILRENQMSAPEQNGVKWPQRGASARVFEIAQTISTQKKDYATKEEVIAAATAEGINEGTAGTQYSAWRRYWEGPSKAAEVPQAPAAPVAPVAPLAPQAPAAIPPAGMQAIVDTVQQANVQAAAAPAPIAPLVQAPPATFMPPQPPAYAPPQAPAVIPMPSGHAAAPAAFQAPAAPVATPQPAAFTPATEGALREQAMAVEVGMDLHISFDKAIAKAQRLAEILQDAANSLNAE